MKTQHTVFFFVPFFLIFFTFNSTLVSSQCQIDQQSLLIQFKNNLLFNSSLSTKLISWNPNSTDCCNWQGVHCSVAGDIIGLDLSNESISAGIHDSSLLFNLTNLKTLNLAANKFNFKQISSKFGSLKNLTYLNLSNSDFSGQIPAQLSNLTSLEVLDLSSLFSYGIRSLKLENPNLSQLVRNLTRITELYLDNVNLSAQKSDWGRSLSSYLPELRVLSLLSCQLSGPLDDSLGKLQSISVIRLAQNNLSAPVPDFFVNFENLTSMNLAACNLVGTFPDKVFRLPRLEILDLSINKNLSGSLPDFPVNGSLRRLVLGNTNFSGGIPKSIENLKNLSRLELPTSNFTGKLPESMKNLTELSYLDLSSNSFTGQIPSFHLCKNLTHIDLSRNILSGSIPSDYFQELHNLVSVDLRLNRFNGSIPSSLFSLQLLQKIQLSNNEFSGPLVNITNVLSSSLDTLDLSSNRLEGRIPKSFFKLKWLSILLLSSNNLNGTIETKDFLGLTNLTNLDLSFNNLSIETSGNVTILSGLPQFSSLRLASCNLRKFPNLRNQSRLIHLDLSSNKIDGEIPSWIWRVGNGGIMNMNLSFNQLTGFEEPYVLPDLSVLDLHFNRLSGVIPIPPNTSTYIDYSNNRFGSSLPESVGISLFYAYYFSVSNNSLSGAIPETICNATYLSVLDLSNNHLTGTIPKCLIESSGNLGVLNLGNNNLSGQIEGMFPSSCGLNTLDLHGNNLEGKFPQSIVNCTMLEVLNLGKNRINDTYPCSLSNNTNLRVLVLRSNMFHGSVLCGQSQSETQQNNPKWLKLQILDIALNGFTGNVPEDCFLDWHAMMRDEADNMHLSFKFLQLNEFYYQDTVTVTLKGLEVQLVKILTIFTSIDISNNRFSGEIPSSVGRLKALYLLNVSHNEFISSIPPSIGDLSQLESLDMSSNKLTGQIPLELTKLSFLSILNLSYNQLEGRIPTSTQLQSFLNTSYEGNDGLCGCPLNTNCTSSVIPAPKPARNVEESKNGYDLQFIFTGIGLGAGSAIVTVPFVFSKQARHFWDKYTNKLVKIICLALGIHYVSYALHNDDEDYENETLESDENSDESEYRSKGDQSKGRYCVFCTKLDFSRREAIHDVKCTCFDAVQVLSSSSLSTSSSEAGSHSPNCEF